MATLARKTGYASITLMATLSATWVAGIYVNGFVPIPPGSSAASILLVPAVEAHFVLASASAAASVLLVGLAWANGSRRLLAATVAALSSIVVAGDSGLAFVLGGGSDSGQSMVMAVAFITAVFLTFLSMATLRPRDPGQATWARGRSTLSLCYAALLLFYAIFVTGMYVNLFVAGPVFSLPLDSQLPAFVRMESSAPFIIHEALGGVLLVTLVVISLSLLARGAKRLALVGAAPALLVAYSAYVGSLNLTSPIATGVSVWVPMLSSTALIVAVVSTILLTLRIRSGLSSR